MYIYTHIYLCTYIYIYILCSVRMVQRCSKRLSDSFKMAAMIRYMNVYCEFSSRQSIAVLLPRVRPAVLRWHQLGPRSTLASVFCGPLVFVSVFYGQLLRGQRLTTDFLIMLCTVRCTLVRILSVISLSFLLRCSVVF